MNYRTRIFLSALIGIGFTSCEQRDDQALIKVYEVFQRDMLKRDETARASMEQIQGEIKSVSDKLEELQKHIPTSGGGDNAVSGEKLAATVADVVGKQLAEQNAAGLAAVKAQIEQLRSAMLQPAAPSQPTPIAAAPTAPPAPAPAAAPAAAPSPGGVRYRDQAPVPVPQPTPSSTKSSDPTRKKYKIEF